MQYCSLQHWILLPSPVTSTTGCCFHFSSISSFFLDLFFYSSLVAYWAPTDLGSSSFSVIYFCLFILFMGFSRQEYWSHLPFPSPVDHILSELFTTTCPCWVALHSIAHSLIELDKSVIHVISLVSLLPRWKRPWCWKRLKAGEGDKRGWGVWMVSLTWWTWVWASPGNWCWTGKPGILQSIMLQSWTRLKEKLGWNWKQLHWLGSSSRWHSVLSSAPCEM